MRALWSFIAKPRNREALSLIGGALIALAAGVWAVVTYVWPAHEVARVVCAQQGSIAAGRDASGNTVNYSGRTAGSGATSCADTAKK
jgi:hypothetical protein